MIPLIVALGSFLGVFIGALVGLWLGRNVPEHYRDSPSQEAMLSVLAALVLGLLTSGADTACQRREPVGGVGGSALDPA
jgi:ABC-type uncharacterized transport system permease subunit